MEKLAQSQDFSPLIAVKQIPISSSMSNFESTTVSESESETKATKILLLLFKQLIHTLVRGKQTLKLTDKAESLTNQSYGPK